LFRVDGRIVYGTFHRHLTEAEHSNIKVDVAEVIQSVSDKKKEDSHEW
jgi:hypothetical protein